MKHILFSSDCPLQILALKPCSQDISKTNTASSYKLGQLIEDNEKITWRKLKKYISYFFELLLFAIFGIENLSSRYLGNYYS